jgi:hypothetical protein
VYGTGEWICDTSEIVSHHYYRNICCKLLKFISPIKCCVQVQFCFQDPFGEERGTFQYRNILTRLQALHVKLSAKCSNIGALSDKTISDNECSSDSDLDQPDEPSGLVNS